MSESDTMYNSCSLPIQLMTIGPLSAPSKCKSGLPRIIGTCPWWWKQSFRLRLWSLVWFQVRVTSCHLTSSKSAWKSTPKCTWMCWRVWWSPGAIRWPVADPGCGSRTRRRPTTPKRPRLGFRRSATTLYPSLTGPPPPPTWTRWSTLFGHTSRTSPTWPHATPNPACSPPSAEYSPSSRQRLWKRHAPSSGSVSYDLFGLFFRCIKHCNAKSSLYLCIKYIYDFFTVSIIVMPNHLYTYIVSKVSDHSRGWPEGSLFDSYYTKV